VDEQLARGQDPGPLAGVPVAVKDVILTKGVRTTCGSKLLANYIPPYDATAVVRLEQAGGVIIGKTNCDEFAMGSSTENSAFGPVRNPVAPDRVPGGSSGGLRSRGGARHCGSRARLRYRRLHPPAGLVLRSGGRHPTYGRVSRYGLTAFASSLDHIGPFSRSVKDSATLLRVIAGRDLRDSTSADAPVPDYNLPARRKRKRLEAWTAPRVSKRIDGRNRRPDSRGVDRLQSLGCQIREISLPSTDYAIACYYIICTARPALISPGTTELRYTFRSEMSDTLSDMYRNTRGEGFGAECKRRIMLGTYVLSSGYYDAYYLKAQKVRALVARDFANAFQEVDAIVAPVSPFPAFRLGEKVDDPLAMYLSDIYTITGSLAGIPCMSVPCGNTAEGLPVGMQILTRHFDETTMFRLADAFEQAQRG